MPVSGIERLRPEYPLARSFRFDLRRSRIETIQAQGSHPSKVFQAHSPVIGFPFALELHAAQACPNPFVDFFEQLSVVRERGGEVIRCTAQRQVQSNDEIIIQVVGTFGNFPNLGFEFLRRLGPHGHRA